MTPTEETTYYSAKVHNTAPQAQKVKVYYETAAPIATERKVVEERVIEPRQHAVFAPRTFTHEGAERRYELSRLELQPTAEELAPVVYETREHRHHHKKHGLFHRKKHHHKHHHATPGSPAEIVEAPVTAAPAAREEAVELRIHENEGAYAFAPYEGTDSTIYRM